jgi:hypothetical protein
LSSEDGFDVGKTISTGRSNRMFWPINTHVSGFVGGIIFRSDRKLTRGLLFVCFLSRIVSLLLLGDMGKNDEAFLVVLNSGRFIVSYLIV